MFVMKKKNAPIEWPVSVSVPQDGGTVDTQKFTAHFKLLTQNEVDEFAAKGDQEFVKKVLVDWGNDIKDESGNPIPFGDDAMESIVNTVHIRKAVVAAYHQCLSGYAAKN